MTTNRKGRMPWTADRPAVLVGAALSGIAFGFLLQKGGVAKFDILIGMLLLEDFVVAKVMLTAITTGMLGYHFLERRGVIRPQIRETTYGGNVLGGLLFGVGFALLAYCPGTDAAAVGQGNLDALVGMAGLVLGSYAFALSSRSSRRSAAQLGRRGKLTVPQLLHVRRSVFITAALPLLVGVLVVLGLFAP